MKLNITKKHELKLIFIMFHRSSVTQKEQLQSNFKKPPTKEQIITRLEGELNAANNRIRELDIEVHQIRPAYEEATRRLVAASLENARLLSIIAQQAGRHLSWLLLRHCNWKNELC